MTLGIIVLAGGKGTRIRPVLGEIPKLLAPIAGKTFLDWIMKWINLFGFDEEIEIVFSTCVGHKQINDYVSKNYSHTKCIKEKTPIGTFGAVINVVLNKNYDNYLILNGDTIFSVNMKETYEEYKKEIFSPLLILKEIESNERYGGYKKVKNSWLPSDNNAIAISLGALFISNQELKRRWNLSFPGKNLSFKLLDQFAEEKRLIMMDKDCIGVKPVRGKLLSKDVKFIDIGVPESLLFAQEYIPTILSK